jgi:hypothetical protein
MVKGELIRYCVFVGRSTRSHVCGIGDDCFGGPAAGEQRLADALTCHWIGCRRCVANEEGALAEAKEMLVRAITIGDVRIAAPTLQIGRASCRERV